MYPPSEGLIALKSFFTDVPSGASITYAEIAKGSGIVMDPSGKALMRRALNSLGREYLCQRGLGITLDSPQTTMPILATKSQRVGRSLSRAQKANARLSRYFPELPPDQQQQALFIGSIFGAMLASAKMLERQYLKPSIAATSSPGQIPIPKFTTDEESPSALPPDATARPRLSGGPNARADICREQSLAVTARQRAPGEHNRP